MNTPNLEPARTSSVLRSTLSLPQSYLERQDSKEQEWKDSEENQSTPFSQNGTGRDAECKLENPSESFLVEA